MKDKKNCVVFGRNTKTGEENIWLNGSMAADDIGCTRVLVYNVLRKKQYYHTAKGWSLEYVDFDDLALKQKKTKKSKKPGAEVQVQQVENMLMDNK